MTRLTTLFPALFIPSLLLGQAATPFSAEIDKRAQAIEQKVLTWRRDFHQHPELSNREVRTAQIVADHLRSLGIEVKTGVAKTGVVGVLRGGRPGRVIALRADMDALPVAEEVDVPFKSTVRTTYAGQDVGVMHACGHDSHTAMLMGVAEILAGMRAQIPGTVKFVFQPAEEGAPAGERGGAGVMIEEGVLENPKVDAIFGLHVFPFESGSVALREGGVMASGDQLTIVVKGRQTHGALPWSGVDPIVVASQIVSTLQTVVSRQIDLTKAPAVLTIGSMHGGVRYNIVPDSVYMIGTLRTFDMKMRDDIQMRVKRTVTSIAEASGATATVKFDGANPVTFNDTALTRQMRPTLERVLGRDHVSSAQITTTSEDYSLFQQKVPGIFFFLGITPKGTDPKTAAPNHSPRFFVDEAALGPGVRAMANLAVDYLSAK
jgi:amidohydrolase